MVTGLVRRVLEEARRDDGFGALAAVLRDEHGLEPSGHDVLGTSDRSKERIARDVSDVGARVRQHGHVTPVVELVRPRGRDLVSDVLVDPVHDLFPLGVIRSVEVLLQEVRVDGQAVGGAVSEAVPDLTLEVLDTALETNELALRCQLVQHRHGLYRLRSASHVLREVHKNLDRSLRVACFKGGVVHQEALCHVVLGHAATLYLSSPVSQRSLPALVDHRRLSPGRRRLVSDREVGHLAIGHCLIQGLEHLRRDEPGGHRVLCDFTHSRIVVHLLGYGHVAVLPAGPRGHSAVFLKRLGVPFSRVVSTIPHEPTGRGSGARCARGHGGGSVGAIKLGLGRDDGSLPLGVALLGHGRHLLHVLVELRDVHVEREPLTGQGVAEELVPVRIGVVILHVRQGVEVLLRDGRERIKRVGHGISVRRAGVHHEVDVRLSLVGSPAGVGVLRIELRLRHGDEAERGVVVHEAGAVAVQLPAARANRQRDQVAGYALGRTGRLVREQTLDVAVRCDRETSRVASCGKEPRPRLTDLFLSLRRDRPAVLGVRLTRRVEGRRKDSRVVGRVVHFRIDLAASKFSFCLRAQS